MNYTIVTDLDGCNQLDVLSTSPMPDAYNGLVKQENQWI